jgi:hypothetical protein
MAIPRALTLAPLGFLLLPVRAGWGTAQAIVNDVQTKQFRRTRWLEQDGFARQRVPLRRCQIGTQRITGLGRNK